MMRDARWKSHRYPQNKEQKKESLGFQECI